MKNEPAPALAAIFLLLLTLPWLNPFSYGPTPAAAQGLVAWIGAAGCVLLWQVWKWDTASQVRLVAAAWLVAAAASSAMGLLQYLGHAAALSPWVDYVDPGQAYANLRQRNQLATLLGIGLSAVLWFPQKVSANGAANNTAVRRQRQVLGAIVVTLLVAADAASGSRTGLVQLLALALLALVWRRGRAGMAWALVAYAIAAFLLPRLIALAPLQSGILGRISEEPYTCGSRLTLWSNTLHLALQRPWTGWGWGELAYAHFVTLYPESRFCEIMGNAHNLPLHLAATLGFPAAIAVCAAVLYGLWRGRPWAEHKPSRQMAWGVLIVMGLHSLLEYPLWYGPFQVAALLALRMLWRPRATAVPVPAAVAQRVRCVVLALCVLLACSYTASDYWRISQIYLPVSQRAAAYRDDTLNKIRPSWLFADQVKFAELGTTPLTAANAEHIHALALEMLHFSPEASVVQKLIDSATLLDLRDEADFYATRFQAAYPQEYVAWLARKGSSPGNKTP